MKKIFLLNVIMSVEILFGCGNDSGNGTEDSHKLYEKDFNVDSLDELLNCTENHEGMTAYIRGENKDYVCKNGDWIPEYNTNSNSEDVTPGFESESSSSVDRYGELVDARDGHIYKTVKIGIQEWMAENLKFDPGDCNRDPKSSCYSTPHQMFSSCPILPDDNTYCEAYGRLYPWFVATEFSSPIAQECYYVLGRSELSSTMLHDICPAGWHLPTKEDFIILLQNTVGLENGEIVETGLMLSDKLRSTLYSNGMDTYGFSAIPIQYDEYDETKSAFFLSSSLASGDANGDNVVSCEDFLNIAQNANFSPFVLEIGEFNVFLHSKSISGKRYSVRCLKDSI